MPPGQIRLERADAVATVIVDQPARRNAISRAMWRAIPDLIADLDRDKVIRVVVVRGAGSDAFSAGADISELADEWGTPERALAYRRDTDAALDALAACTKPTIAVVQGFCLGGGCELAICCDLRLAGTSASFGIPAARIGANLGWDELRRLVALVGPANAKEILFTGARVDAARAHTMGLVNRVVRDPDLATALADVLAQLLEASPATLRWSKHAITALERDLSLGGSPDRAAEHAALFENPDYHEGIRAFLERRKPRFTGR